MSDEEQQDPRKPLSNEDLQALRPEFGAPRLIATSKGGRSCEHQFVAVLRDRDVVVCRSCGDEVAAIDVLRTLAHEWDWATYNSQKRDKLEKEVAELEAEEKRIKGRIRKARAELKTCGEDRVAALVDELLTRLRATTNYLEFEAVKDWFDSGRWMSGDEHRRVQEAFGIAFERVKLNGRQARAAHRGVKVVKGGKS